MARDATAWAARRKELEQDISTTHPKNRRRATATEDAMSAMKSRWAEFSNVVFNGESGKDTISKAGVTDFKLFLEWRLENSKNACYESHITGCLQSLSAIDYIGRHSGSIYEAGCKIGLKDKLLSSGLLRDPNAPASLSAANQKEIEALPIYSAAKKSITKMRIMLKTKYGKNYVLIASAEEKGDYKMRRSKLNNVRRKLAKEILDKIREHYFANTCNEEIRWQQQHQDGEDQGEAKEELDILSASRQLGERVQLLLDIVCEKLGCGEMGTRVVTVVTVDETDKNMDDQWDCVYCDAKGLSTKYTLKKHMQNYLRTLEEPWCMKCDKHYEDKACLQVHLLDFHGITT
ncbi:hypothetical protein EV426DRAFT_707113 [Tirmania nivea]|nr:hypothetical protein EV426DRAFT_707113 [Tirmania nivea]